MKALPRPETVTLGLGLMALGLAWTLANLGYINLLHTLRIGWPGLLIVWGALELLATFQARTGGGR